MKTELIAECSRIFDVHHRDITGPSKFRFATVPRFALYKAMRMRGLSFAQIGRFMNRDHTTIIHGVSRAERMARRDPDYADKVQRLIDFELPYTAQQSTIGVAPTDNAAYDTTPLRSST